MRRVQLRVVVSALLGATVLALSAGVAHAFLPGAWTTGGTQHVSSCQIVSALQPNSAGTLKRGVVSEMHPGCAGDVYGRIRWTEFGMTEYSPWAHKPATAYTIYAINVTGVQPGH